MTLPQGWEEAPLLDVVELHDSRRVPLNAAERAAMPGSYPYYGANGQVGSVGDFLFEGKHILVAEDGGYFDQPERGVAYEVDGRFWVNNHAHILSTCGDMPTGFITRLLNTIDWLQYVSGTTRLKLTQGGMQRIRLPIPPLAEQRRIVAKLDALTARLARARAELDRVPVLADRLRASVLEEVFSPSNLARWHTVRMEDQIAEGLIGLVRSKAEQGDTGVPYIRMNHYDLDGRINEEKLTFVDCSKAELARFQLQAGDVLFNTRNSVELVGKVTIWPQDMPGRVYNNNILRLRFGPNIDPRFAFRYMMSPFFRDLMEQEKSATTSVAAIYQRSLYAAPLPVPPKDEQETLARQIEAAFARADRLEAEATRARALLDRLESALLAKAFRGELVPQDPNDEPAQVLLDRIRTQRANAPKAKRGRKAKVAA